MMYKTEIEFLSSAIQSNIIALRDCLVRDTDYDHVQLTFDDLRDGCTPTMHVIVGSKFGGE